MPDNDNEMLINMLPEQANKKSTNEVRRYLGIRESVGRWEIPHIQVYIE